MGGDSDFESSQGGSSDDESIRSSQYDSEENKTKKNFVLKAKVLKGGQKRTDLAVDLYPMPRKKAVATGKDIKKSNDELPAGHTKKRKQIVESDSDVGEDDRDDENMRPSTATIATETLGMNKILSAKKIKTSPTKMPSGGFPSGVGAPKAKMADPILSSSSSSLSAPDTDASTNFRGPDITTEKAAKQLIFRYLKHQNRPYNAIQIFENLHRRIMKSTVERALDALTTMEDKPILMKTYKTNKIYWASQKKLPVAGASELRDMDSTINMKKSEVDALEKRQALLTKQLNDLTQEPTDDELDAVLAANEAEVTALQKKADLLSMTKMDPQAYIKSIQKHNLYRLKWIEGKNRVMDVVNNIADGMEKKPSVIMADLGIETDKDVNVTIPAAISAPK